MSAPIRIASIGIHPVKSTAIRPVERARLTRAGLAGDREWMVVDSGGDLVSARELPRLFSIVADNAASGFDEAALRLSAPGLEPLLVDLPGADRERSVRMFTRPPMTARSAGPAAGAWLEQALQRTGLDLVWCADPTARQLNPEFSRPDDHAAFQDGYPVTLLSTASMAGLRQEMDQVAAERGEQAPGFGAERFRMNLLVEGVAEAFAEDTWTSVRIGEVPCRVAKRVDRCVMTTVDPATFTTGKEPIRTLAGFRRWEGKTWMAIHLIPDGEGTIAVGDEVLPDR